MKRRKLILKLSIYYIVGLILFIIISYSIHIILFTLLTNDIIIPSLELQMITNNLFHFLPWYVGVYTIFYLLIVIILHKYDRHIVKKLNEKLENKKGEDKNEQN